MSEYDYDVIVIGGGTGNKVASAAAGAGMRAALIRPGPIGGTCLNRDIQMNGCWGGPWQWRGGEMPEAVLF